MKLNLIAAWEAFDKKEALERAIGNKEVEYVSTTNSKENTKKKQSLKFEQIMEALVFWEFIRLQIREIFWWDNEPANCKELRLFLSGFHQSENPYTKVVAMIEYLPTSVIRKMLWEYNIDFVSFESMLRRLTDEQILNINENFSDFKRGKLPRVFSRWHIFWNKITHKSLIEEGFVKKGRYHSKSSMSYNLLGLDFGFNAFPYQTKNDTKVVEISPFRFISDKQHADDFVVNREFGKYWWAYKKARSNYVWRPNHEVELKTHICPGFWITLFLHLLFWILSPICSALVLKEVMAGTAEWTPGFIALVAGGAFTGFWIILATFKFILVQIITGADWCFSKIKKSLENQKKINQILEVVAVLLIIAILISLSYALSFPWTETWLSLLVFGGIFAYGAIYIEAASFHEKGLIIPACEFPESTKKQLRIMRRSLYVLVTLQHITFLTALLGAIFHIIGYFFEGIVPTWNKITEWIAGVVPPLWKHITIFFADVWAWIVMAINTVILALGAGFSSIGKTTLIFVEEATIFAVIILLMYAIPFILGWMINKYSEIKKYPKVSQFIAKFGRIISGGIMVGAVLGIVGMIIYSSQGGKIVQNESSSIEGMLYIILSFIIIFYLLKLRSLHRADRRYVNVEEILTYKYFDSGYKRRLTRVALKNSWFISLPDEQKKRIIDGLEDLIINRYAFGKRSVKDRYSPQNILEMILQYIRKEETLTQLWDMHRKSYLELRDSIEDIIKAGYFYDFLELTASNSAAKAMKKILKKVAREKKMAAWKKSLFIKRINEAADQAIIIANALWIPISFLLYVLVSPFYILMVMINKIFNAIVWVGKKIKNMFVTIYKLYELFNKKCPYVAPQRNLFS